jgi:hypothetical protein
VGDDFLCDDLVVVRMFEPFAAGLAAQLRLRQRELDRHLQIFFDIARRIFVTWYLAHCPRVSVIVSAEENIAGTHPVANLPQNGDAARAEDNHLGLVPASQGHGKRRHQGVYEPWCRLGIQPPVQAVAMLDTGEC